MSNSKELIINRLRNYFDHAEHGAKAEFCKNTGIHPQNLKNWLAGTKMPMEAIDQIAKGLGVQPWELIKPEGAEPTQSEPTPQEALEVLVKHFAKRTPEQIDRALQHAAVDEGMDDLEAEIESQKSAQQLRKNKK